MRKSRNDRQQHRGQHVENNDARSVGEQISKIVHGDGRLVDQSARNGHYGILIMTAYLMHGVDSLGQMCRHLRIPNDDLIVAFNNLNSSGLIGENSWPNRNKESLLSLQENHQPRTLLIDWCQIAATASGYLGALRSTRGM